MIAIDYGRTDDGYLTVFIYDGKRWTYTITDSEGKHFYTGTARSKVLAMVGSTAARRGVANPVKDVR